jgi:hypothetical protein
VDQAIPELELQHALERFTTQFVDRIRQATEALEREAQSSIREEALRKALYYTASAIEIATGPFAQINLLDMLVFIRLTRAVLHEHWIPELYGAQGGELADAFDRAERELAQIASTTLDDRQRAQVASLVDAWLADNPSQFRVEGIRFADFAEAAGSAAAERALQAKGMLASLHTATRAANLALLFTERAMFLLHRLPFLWRLHARLTARELLHDAVTQLIGDRAVARAARVVGRGVAYAGLLGAAGAVVVGVRLMLRR